MCSHGFNVHFGQVDVPKGVVDDPAGRSQGTRAPGPRRICRRGGVPCLIALGEGAGRPTPEDRPGLRQGHRRHPRRRHRNHLRRRNRDRPVRRAGRALRRRERAGQGRLRNAGRGRLPARDGLLRMHARAQADRRFVLPGRPELHAVQRLEHGRIRRLHPRPADRHRRDQGRDEADSEEIQNGQFAREWILENRANAPAFKAPRRRERDHPVEEVGRRCGS